MEIDFSSSVANQSIKLSETSVFSVVERGSLEVSILSVKTAKTPVISYISRKCLNNEELSMENVINISIAGFSPEKESVPHAISYASVFEIKSAVGTLCAHFRGRCQV